MLLTVRHKLFTTHHQNLTHTSKNNINKLHPVVHSFVEISKNIYSKMSIQKKKFSFICWECRPPKLSECAPLFMSAFKIRNAGAILHSHAIESVGFSFFLSVLLKISIFYNEPPHYSLLLCL